MPRRGLHIATFEDVVAGRVTDAYFVRTMEILRAKGLDKEVRAEVIAKNLPGEESWAVLAGIEEASELLTTLDVAVRAMPEGTIFRPYQPVLELAGSYQAFAIYETPLLGLLCQASGVATKAARCRKLAGAKTLISFGARRMHPAISPMVERAAFLGGCDGTSVIISAELLGEQARGTMPHALIIVFAGEIGDPERATVVATEAFDEVVDPAIPRISLIDTFNDEKFEAMAVAAALGRHLSGVRLDTPASRRGNFHRILEEVRWELDLRGYQHVKLFVSGGIDEDEIRALNDIADAYGVGTSISDAPTIDFALDIVAVDGQPLAKRGKQSGAKGVWRCPRCFADAVTPLDAPPPPCPCGGRREELLRPLVADRKLLAALPTPQDIRRYVLDQLEHVTI